MNVNQVTQGNNPDASANFPEKRKRGRPRKYPKLNAEDNARIPKIHRMNWEDNAGGGGPPGFGGVNGSQPRPLAASNDAANSMVGRAVSGVIEAVFEAGYLLNVRVANSETTLRGVVFKPGRFVPVSADNDVAPSVQMIRRNDIPLPTEHHNARPKERKEHSFGEQRVASYSANNAVSKGKQIPLVAAQTARSDPVIARGNVVPVVLEPLKTSNGLPHATESTPLATQASHATDSKGKQPPEEATRPLNGSISTTQLPTFGTEAVLSQPQNTKQLVPEVAQNENGLCNQPSVGIPEAKSTRPPTMPFENLVTEVIKRIESPSQSAEGQAMDGKPANKMLKDEDETNNDDQALDIEPLQAVLLSGNINKPISAPNPTEDARTSKMSQLLEVLQGTVAESPVPQAVAPKFTATPSLATKQGDQEARSSVF